MRKEHPAYYFGSWTTCAAVATVVVLWRVVTGEWPATLSIIGGVVFMGAIDFYRYVRS